MMGQSSPTPLLSSVLSKVLMYGDFDLMSGSALSDGELRE